MNAQPRNHVLDRTEAPGRKLLRLAWPVSASMLLHNSYNLIDMLWVADLGKEAVASVALFGIAFFLVFAVSQVFATGVHALVARAYGANNTEQAMVALRDGLLTAFVAGIGFALLMRWCPQAILRALGANDRVARYGSAYAFTMAAAFPLAPTLFTLGNAFRATGDMRTPLVLTAVSCCLNIVLDPLLIYGIGPFPELGLAGAAFATVLSMAAAFVAGIVLMVRHPVLGAFSIKARWNIKVFRDLIAVGLPAGVHYVFLSLTQTVMIRMVAEFGTPVLAAAGIGARLTGLSFLPCMGLGAATATIVGQHLGARRQDEAEHYVHTALKINLFLNAFICGLFLVIPGLFIAVFSRDPEVLAAGKVYLRIFGLGFMFITSTIILTRVFQGAGDTLWPTIIAAVRFGFFVVASLLLGWHTKLGAAGVWASMALSSAVQLGLIGWLYSLGTWKRKHLASVDAGNNMELEVDWSE